MGWQHGEIWFDADIVWSGECPARPPRRSSAAIHAPSFFGLPRAGLAYVAAPNGLAASRSRRAERRRRQEAKRTWAAALVLAPTVLLTATGERLGIARGQPPTLDEDPPSLTFRPGLAENPVRPPGRATHLNRLTDRGGVRESRGIGRQHAGFRTPGRSSPGRSSRSRARTGSRGTPSTIASRTSRSGCSVPRTRSGLSSP